MKDTLQAASALVLATEGGWSDNPADPGGPTNKGITLSTFVAWRKRQSPDAPTATIADLRALSDEEAIAIFDAQYADPIHYEELPDGLDYCVFDCSVNSGPARATKILQAALGFEAKDVDGILGSKTLASAQAVNDVATLIKVYQDDRLAFMQTLTIWGTFGKGWTSRVNTVGTQALAFMTKADPAAIPTQPVSVQAKATGATKLLASFNGKAAVASTAGALIIAGGLASQLASVLSPYSQVKMISYVLIGCSVLSSAIPLWTAIKRAASGEAAT